jgi:small subunit ribosomal protein S3
MGQKTHPKGVRLGYIIRDPEGNVPKARDWDSKWFNLKEMPMLIEEDFKIRSFLRQRLRMAAVSRIGIERAGKKLIVKIYTARPGIVIGKKGADIEGLRTAVEQITGREADINVMEIKQPEKDAQLVSEGVAMQLEKQVGFRRAMKRAIERAMQSGALGIKVQVAGRLGGAEIARTEWMKEGRLPLQTLRADIDYGFSEARINMGCIGVKVWIFSKERFRKTETELMEEVRRIEKEKLEELAKQAEEAPAAAEPSLVVEESAEDAEEVMAELIQKEDVPGRRHSGTEPEKGA